MKHLKVLENFEQGLERKEGGAIKLLGGQQVAFEESEHGYLLHIRGKVRTVSKTVFEGWISAGLIEIVEA